MDGSQGFVECSESNAAAVMCPRQLSRALEAHMKVQL